MRHLATVVHYLLFLLDMLRPSRREAINRLVDDDEMLDGGYYVPRDCDCVNCDKDDCWGQALSEFF